MFVLNLSIRSSTPLLLSGEFPEDRMDGVIDALQREVGTIIDNSNTTKDTDQGYKVREIYIDIQPREGLEEINIAFICFFIYNFLTRGEAMDGALKM